MKSMEKRLKYSEADLVNIEAVKAAYRQKQITVKPGQAVYFSMESRKLAICKNLLNSAAK